MFFEYKPGDDVGQLDEWPFDNPLSDYKIIEGTPVASGRYDKGGPGEQTRFGIWRCTKGIFECTELGDELMTILSGRCRLTNLGDGSVYDLGPGDSILTKDGSRVIWDVTEDVTKVFFGYKSDKFN